MAYMAEFDTVCTEGIDVTLLTDSCQLWARQLALAREALECVNINGVAFGNLVLAYLLWSAKPWAASSRMRRSIALNNLQRLPSAWSKGGFAVRSVRLRTWSRTRPGPLGRLIICVRPLSL